MTKYSYIFILSRIDIEAELPFEVIPGHFFQKATSEEINEIKQLLNLIRPTPINWYPYERTGEQILPGVTKGSVNIVTKELPESEWAYWVISFEGYNDKIPDLRSACSLLKDDIELGFEFLRYNNQKGNQLGGHSEFSYLSQHSFGTAPAFTLTSKELSEIGKNYDLISNLGSEYLHIKKAMKRFVDLQRLPRNSDLLIVGLFSIMESIITHDPSESSRTLTYQISHKIPLLSSGFIRNLDYSQYFDYANEIIYWKKLYEYRSKIVHSGNAEIDKELKILKNQEMVIRCLRKTVKLLLLYALKEPKFLTDLKYC